MKALEILASLYKDVLHWENRGISCTNTSFELKEAIAELEALQTPKTCEACKHRLNPNRQFPSFSCALLKRHVRNDFYCVDYEPKDN